MQGLTVHTSVVVRCSSLIEVETFSGIHVMRRAKTWEFEFCNRAPNGSFDWNCDTYK